MKMGWRMEKKQHERKGPIRPCRVREKATEGWDTKDGMEQVERKKSRN